MRFNLVDAVLERGEGRVVTLKGVTSAEEYLGDHFPGFAVLPGVMMLEAMVQAARVLSAEEGGPRWVLAEVRNVRYGNMVRPGQRLRVTVERMGGEGDRQTFKGVGEVEGDGVEGGSAVAVQGRFVLRPLGADVA